MIVKKPLVPVGMIAAVGLWTGMLALKVALVLVIGLPFKWRWSAALPSLISVRYITYAQGVGVLGLILLARAIVRGMKLKLAFNA